MKALDSMVIYQKLKPSKLDWNRNEMNKKICYWKLCTQKYEIKSWMHYTVGR
jgi:hypothetical protein